MFALSVRYQPVDVSLAISSGLLNVLSQLCGTETMLGQPLHLLQKPGVSQLSTALKVASTRPVIPINARTLRITAAAGTELAGASSVANVKSTCY